MLNDAGIYRLGLTTRTKVFNGIECYVVSDSYNESFRENYINKETGELVKIVSGSENFYNEELFTLTENVVEDKDVDKTILEGERYKDYKKIDIEYEATEEINLYYDIIRK